VEIAHSASGSQLDIEILGKIYQAEVLGAPIYDPNGDKMRG